MASRLSSSPADFPQAKIDPQAGDISLVIPAHRQDDNLARCLHAVQALQPAPREVIVVLSNQALPEAEALEARGFRVVPLEAPRLAGAARNAGAEIAKGYWLIFLDSDCMASPDFLEEAVRALKRVPNAIAAFGSYDDEPTEPDTLSRFRNLLHHFTHQRAGAGEAATFWTACGIVRADVFRELGGFRDMAMEDIDFGYRLRRRGGKIALDPAWQVKHGKRWTPGDMIRTDVILRTRPWFRLLREERRAGRSASPCLRVEPDNKNASGGFSAAIDHLRFLEFLRQKAGWLFAVRCLPWLGVVFLSAGIGWLLSWLPWPRQDQPPEAFKCAGGITEPRAGDWLHAGKNGVERL